MVGAFEFSNLVAAGRGARDCGGVMVDFRPAEQKRTIARE